MSSVGNWFEDNQDGFIDFGVMILTTIVILVIGVVVIRWVARILDSVLHQSKTLDPSLVGFFVSIAKFAMRFILLIIVLGQLSINNTSFIAVGGAAVFALAFALQGALGNFAAGVMILTFRQFQVGHLVELGGVFGHVKVIELFTTTVVTLDGKHVIIPNGDITSGNIINLTAAGKVRVDLVAGIGYDDDIDLAKKILWGIINKDPRCLKSPTDPKTVIQVGELGDNSVNIFCRPWVDPEDYFGFTFDFHYQVKKNFDKHGVSIPYPQRDVHLDFVPPEPEGVVSKTEDDQDGLDLNKNDPEHSVVSLKGTFIDTCGDILDDIDSSDSDVADSDEEDNNIDTSAEKKVDEASDDEEEDINMNHSSSAIRLQDMTSSMRNSSSIMTEPTIED